MAQGFFSYVPPEPPPETAERQAPPWMQPPADELPNVIPMPSLVARSEQAVVTVSVAEVFSVGVSIPVTAIARRKDESPSEWQLKHNLHYARHPQGAIDGLRLGAELADGRRLGVDPGFLRPGISQNEPDGPVLTQHNGGGGGSSDTWNMRLSLWLWPLPPEGPLDLVVEWRSLGLPESRVTLDGTAIREAAAGVRPLWGD